MDGRRLLFLCCMLLLFSLDLEVSAAIGNGSGATAILNRLLL
jgi:hypothetical protein